MLEMLLRRTSSDLTSSNHRRRQLARSARVLALSMLACSGEDAGDDPLSKGAGSTRGAGSEGDDTSAGGSTPAPGAEGDTAQAMLAAHNSVRRALDDPQPELSWSAALASYAAEWAEELAQGCGSIRHRAQSRYGENIAMRGSSRSTRAYTPEEAVAGWAAEAACWEFGTIRGSETCRQSCVAELNSNGCGHYTQLIWRDTQRVGCGYATCTDGYTFEIWVCNYDPPGNFVGQAPY